jgi:phosphocarrier protein HPr|tara:strand:+ start:220 stop:516 length:297 start_codon:yes stop_codon:yes gene_type:complete
MNDGGVDPGAPVRRQVTICNERGLHARAAAKFVRLASQYDCEITVTKSGTSVSGISIMGLMMLAAACDCSLELEAKGPEAEAALDALAHLIDNRFDED